MSRATVDRIIRVFGSQQALADALGIDQSSVSGWRRRGVVPAKRQAGILEVARKQGLAISPEDFFEAGAAGASHEEPQDRDGVALLTVAQSYAADEAAVAFGVDGLTLMENAGNAIARAVLARWRPLATTVLCGPGNNGGDGFVVARLLRDQGWPVRVALLGEVANLRGDAAANAARWAGPVEPLEPSVLRGAGLVVDALFGAGLSRPVEGTAAAVIERANALSAGRVAVDVPSGVNGDTGEIGGAAFAADVTVTFFRAKPGHWLLPGRLRTGVLDVADIGIPDTALATIAPQLWRNDPVLWQKDLRAPTLLDHKYSRGHVLVAGGDRMTGAARLAARGARRAGAGMVSIACPAEAWPVYAASDPGLIVRPLTRPADFRALAEERKVAALVVGPGNGVSDRTRALTLMALSSGKPCVLDADALTVMAGAADSIARTARGPCILTPHEGEFGRLFEVDGDKLTRAREAARTSQAVIVLKGGDTVVAAPDGRAVIETGAPSDLATAGAGDVLAGIAGALLAQGVQAFEAACAAVWLHAAAAREAGPGLVAEDLPQALRTVLAGLVRSGHGVAREPNHR